MQLSLKQSMQTIKNTAKVEDECEVVECEEGKIWNADSCECQCEEVIECALGWTWNPATCRCER